MRNILFILATLMFCSCQTKQDPIPKDHSPNDHPLIGKWSLVSATAYIVRPEHYEEGSIIWEFDTKNKVNIEMKIELPERTLIRPSKSGVFPFTLREPDKKNMRGKIKINGVEWCEYRITDQKNEFVLDCGMAYDGPGFFFKRAE